MPEVIKGRATWPGASQVIGADYTCDWGTSPGSARIDVPLEDAGRVRRTGDLTFTDGITTRVLKDCIIAKGQLADAAGGGKCLRLTILDRRWKWAYGVISARYNLRDDRGVLIDDPRSPDKIATDILDAMREKNYVVDLPAGVSLSETPLMDFDAIRPDQALNEIAEKFARVVVWQPWTDRVMIVRPGYGSDLPNIDATDFNITVDPAELPSKVQILGSPITYQCVFRLLPAAIELDGSIVPLDDASYKPVIGWGKSRLRSFRDIVVPAVKNQASGISFGVKTRDEVSALAASCVWKVFRFSALDPVTGQGFIKIPGLEFDAPDVEVKTPYQLDFLDGIVYSDTKDPKAKPFTMPVEVFGSVYKGAVPFFNPYRSNDLTIASDSFIGVGFQVDNARKIITSDRYLLLTENPADPNCLPPVLYCKISVQVRDKNGGLVRYSKDRRASNESDTLPLVVNREDCQRVRMVEYDHSTWQIKKAYGNSEAVDTIMDYYLDAEFSKLEQKKSGSKTYPGIEPIEPDGALCQVTWHVGDGSPTTTTASVNFEHKSWVPGFMQRQFFQRLKAFIDRPIQFMNRKTDEQVLGGNGPRNIVFKPMEGI